MISEQEMTFKLVHPVNLEDMIWQTNPLIMDIRSREEYEMEHWPDALNFPNDEIDRWKNKIPRRRILLIYCEHGGSSMVLARELGKEGYRTYTVVGGYEAMKKVRKNYSQNY